MDNHLIMFMIGTGVKLFYERQRKTWNAYLEVGMEPLQIKRFEGSGETIEKAVQDLYINYMEGGN